MPAINTIPVRKCFIAPPGPEALGRAKQQQVKQELRGAKEQATSASGNGTFETCRRTLKMSAYRGRSGVVGAGHKTDMPTVFRDVRFQGQSGKHLLALSFSGFDPDRSSLADFVL
jgi:hypothetical protein